MGFIVGRHRELSGLPPPSSTSSRPIEPSASADDPPCDRDRTRSSLSLRQIEETAVRTPRSPIREKTVTPRKNWPLDLPAGRRWRAASGRGGAPKAQVSPASLARRWTGRRTDATFWSRQTPVAVRQEQDLVGEDSGPPARGRYSLPRSAR
jgi:hypothetical protein